MPKIKGKKLRRIHTIIFDEDYEKLREQSTPDLPVSMIIRTIIHSYVLHTENQSRINIDSKERSSAEINLAQGT